MREVILFYTKQGYGVGFKRYNKKINTQIVINKEYLQIYYYIGRFENKLCTGTCFFFILLFRVLTFGNNFQLFKLLLPVV